MPRSTRPDFSGMVVHVLNRAAGRQRAFAAPEDRAALLRALVEAHARVPLRILAFCVMPTHWHLVAWPRGPDDISRFAQRLGLIHAVRWHAVHDSVGTGALFQGRFRAFPAQTDGHALTLLRYVERNALRANLVSRAEDWEWGSLWHRLRDDPLGLLSGGPVALPEDWTAWVNTPQTQAELEALRQCAHRGTPFGAPAWVDRTARRLGLSGSLRPRGRPKKGSDPFSDRKGV